MANTDLAKHLTGIVGRRHVVTRAPAMRRFTKGYRFGEGTATAAVVPGTLVELWRVLEVCTDADAIVIMQAANTGLTGGSTPFGDYDRRVVIVSTRRLQTAHLIDSGREAISLPGATLDQLERMLAPLGREPHSVIGSSCLGASVIGGICNNSGGALIKRGPAFTRHALFARRGASGELELVNHLGIELPAGPEDMLAALEAGRFDRGAIVAPPPEAAIDYEDRVRRVDEPTPARYNADPSFLHEASGSAGHLAVFAARTDTFPKAESTQVFYIGTNDPADLTKIRRDILSTFTTLPISAEYMHRGTFDLAASHGKDMFLAIRLLGTHRLPLINRMKEWIDRATASLPLIPANLADRLLHAIASLLPNHLPKRLRQLRDRYEHHLLIRTADETTAEMATYLGSTIPGLAAEYLICSPAEGEDAFLHRFVAAGAAIRYRALNPKTSAGLVSLDIALPRDKQDWAETLPPELARQIARSLSYGHFFCHVFHQDYVAIAGCKLESLEEQLLTFHKARGAKYPAEHGVGHLYHAEETLERHFQELDPTNSFNPGIGRLTRGRNWLRRASPE